MRRQTTLYREDDSGETEITVNGWFNPGEREVRYGPNAIPFSPPEIEIENATTEDGTEITLTGDETSRAIEQMFEFDADN